MKEFDFFTKSIEYIENNLTENIKLDDIAEIAACSKFHYLRLFKTLVGQTPISYLRERRLSHAADELIKTSNNILDIAIKYNFESHESFTRSFKNFFHKTPKDFRSDNIIPNLFMRPELTTKRLEHLIMGGITMKPEIRKLGNLNFIGMEITTNLSDNKIPQLWDNFIPRMEEIKNIKEENIAYGICMSNEAQDYKDFTNDTDFKYLAAVSVNNFDDIPDNMTKHSIEEGRYAVFTHIGPLANLQMTYDYIYGVWVKKSDFKLAGKNDFERYDERFNPVDEENSSVSSKLCKFIKYIFPTFLQRILLTVNKSSPNHEGA